MSQEIKENIVRVGDIEIGGEKIVLIAGPCVIESFEQLVHLGLYLKSIGVSILRASAFKTRSSPYSFQGWGKEALLWHKKAKESHGLLIETEVIDTRDVAEVAEHVDLLRIGARNMQNTPLLKEVGRTKKPVILKRGFSSTIEEWLFSAEYILREGNPNVILCERGIRTFETSTRYTLDLSAVALAKKLTNFPVIVDPSHATGRRDLVPALSKAAVAVGADGLLIEVHQEPQKALCDGPQALLPEELQKLILELKPIAKAVQRTL